MRYVQLSRWSQKQVNLVQGTPGREQKAMGRAGVRGIVIPGCVQSSARDSLPQQSNNVIGESGRRHAKKLAWVARIDDWHRWLHASPRLRQRGARLG
eukprot:CAMPEP_0206514882 /NCGR_PEP_ID=MMETSP0324_2-20121206/62413_1 /ASSEMBLY_ACC=CAM_ASM_000836 /TAXON_ID=2866 /ORGANISM="Crypthecodinium cohnii, Strain Seligo" /LENGTH=96 /DNA_ID=CAMNT_0054007463 /DNA_START=400 /DNA_END=690 /DNA_ORIENTATION=-